MYKFGNESFRHARKGTQDRRWATYLLTYLLIYLINHSIN
jgi:hypothetical protein